MTSFSSPRSAQGSLNTSAASLSPCTPASSVASSKAEVEAPRSKPATGGVEMVLDLNMNASTCLPKKQKPRTRAQRESYINVRRNGACEKHRKQHKKCNCLEKASSRVSSGGKARAAQSTREQRQPAEELHGQQFGPYHYENVPIECSDAVEPSDLDISRERYTCLMPGCTYSSRTVPSLQQHYSRHSFRSVHTAPVHLQVPTYQHPSGLASSQIAVSTGNLLSVPEVIPTAIRRTDVPSSGYSLLSAARILEKTTTLASKPSQISGVDVSAGIPAQTQSEVYASTEKVWREVRWRAPLYRLEHGLTSQPVQTRTLRGAGDALLAWYDGYLVHCAISALVTFWRFALAVACWFQAHIRAAAVFSCYQTVVTDMGMGMRPLLT
ncbi:hypothetical protein VTN00DRAFT_9569 [Thermoascus crustaceus]|uniref:uncharacterized protein n=1 Tax=Thermoascus crustaceus TaxID=5088 RepID=UPI003741F6B0